MPNKLEISIGNPFIIQFNLLKRCIFNCPYCYLKHQRSDAIFLFSDYKKFFDKLDKYNKEYGLTYKLNITGGDIWYHPEINKILKFSFDKKYVIKIALLINSLWHKDSKKIVLSIKDKIGLIQLNIDSKNLFDDIGFLDKNNIKSAIKIFLSKDEKYFQKQIKILKSVIEKNQKIIISLDRLCPIDNNQKKEMLSNSELIKKIVFLQRITKNLISVDDPLLKSLIYDKINTKFKIGLKGCIIPNGGVAIYPNGDIKLCSRIPSFQTGFNTRNFELVKYINKYISIRQNRLKKCCKCEYFDSCQGGCPATSYYLTKKFQDINCLNKKNGNSAIS